MTMCEVGNLSAQVSAATYPGKRKKKKKSVKKTNYSCGCEDPDTAA